MNREHTQEEIRAALACIPSEDREVWWRMGMALKHEFGEEGWPLFDEWSQAAKNYDATAAASTWKSFDVSGGVTIGTLLREAKQHGFDPKRYAPATSLSDEERARREADRKQREADEEAKRQERQRDAAAKADALWKRAAETGESDYLQRKGVKPFGLRFGKGCILVPVRGPDQQLWNVQRIFDKPNADTSGKIFLAGGRVSGGYHLIGEPASEGWLLVAEGYATAATLHQATGYPVAVAFNASNLRHVAEALRRLHPNARLLVCADDDRATEVETGKNPGLTAAKEAARRARGLIAVPQNPPEGGSDFNDVGCAHGLAEVQRQIEAAMQRTPEEATRIAQAASFSQSEGVDSPSTKKPAKEPQSRWKEGQPWFEVGDDGVWYHGYSDQGESLRPFRVCSRLDVMAESRDENNTEWGILLKVVDALGNQKQWVMPARMLAGDGSEYRAHLLSLGLKIEPGQKAKNLLATYIQEGPVTPTFARCTDRIGWHGGAFVLPDRTLGDADGEQVVFQSSMLPASQFKQSSTLEEWKEQVASLCVGNSRLVFCVSMAFAGPLLLPAGLQSGGFHLMGDSSTGKTTGLRVAASVYGGRDYPRSWRATDNALEATATQYSDALLILDEIGQVDPKIIGDTVYMLANEAGKARATRTGTARPAFTWRLLFLSDGEVRLSDHMAEAGKSAKAGQEIRLANIPADAGEGLGVFEDLHGFESGKALSDHLQRVACEYYGVVGIQWLQWIVDNRAELGDLRDCAAALARDWAGIGAHGQVHRVASRFALVGLAGEMATKAGLTGWPEGEAKWAAKACFDAWLKERGGDGNSEDQAILRQIRDFIERHGSSRFELWHRLTDDHAPKAINRAGYRRMLTSDGAIIDKNEKFYAEFGEKMHPEDGKRAECEWLVSPEVFRNEMCKGYDHKRVVRLLVKRGILVWSESENRADLKTWVPSIGRQRLYRITSALFEQDE